MSQQFQNLTEMGGLITDRPADKIPIQNASDIANIDLSSLGLIQTRGGYDRLANDVGAVGTNLRGYLYVKNFGENKRIKLRVRDDGTNSHLEWHNPSNPDTGDGKWETLEATLTQGAVMGFATANGNGGSNVNLLMFCNGTDNMSKWNGATALVASVTSNTITKSGTSTFTQEGFSATGNVLIDGTTYAYTGGAGTTTLTGVTPDPTVQAPAANSGIAQEPDTTTLSSNTKGNILLTAQRKMWVAGEANYENRVTYTQTGDVTADTGGSGLDAAGSFTLIDAPGDIKLLDAFGKDSLIIHKENALVKYIRGNDGTSVIEQFDTLSQNADVGASNLKAGAGLNQVSYYMTKTEGLKSLQKAMQDDSLNLESISDVIAPTLKNYDFSNAASVYYSPKKVIYVACKSSSDVSVNDKVIAYYIRRGAQGQFTGEFSIDDLFVADWIVDGINLYYCSSIDQNVYQMFTRNSDAGTGVDHKWVSKEFTFDEPARGKEFNKLYIEGFIKEGTKINVTVQYGILGSKGSQTKGIAWNDSFVSTQKISALGDDVVGAYSIGASSADIQDSYTFSVPIHFNVNKSTRYKVKVETVYDDDTNEDSYWAISNISTNPDLKTIDGNAIKNSNS